MNLQGIPDRASNADWPRQFDSVGYVAAPGLLSAAKIEEYRSKLQRLSGLNDHNYRAGTPGVTICDAIARHRELWPLVFEPDLLAAVRGVLGREIRFVQHSDAHAHHGNFGWHRDCACRTFGVGPDWNESAEKYQVARVAIYLHSYRETGSALGVIPGSHRRTARLTRAELRLWSLARRVTGIKTILPLVTRRPVWIKTEPGDAVIFDPRLLHSGTPIRGPKYSLFVCYAAPSAHALNHQDYYRHARKDQGYRDLPAQLVGMLKDCGLFLDREGRHQPLQEVDKCVS